MFSQILALYKLLTNEQRRRLLRLQFLVLVMAIAEVGGVTSIAPFMAVVSDINSLEGTGTLANLYSYSGLSSPEQFIFWAGVGVLVSLSLAALISMYTTWRLLLHGQQIGEELCSRLYSYYIYQPWMFHSLGNSSNLANKISQETARVVAFIVTPLLQMNAKLVMASVMIIALFAYNPKVALIGVGGLALSYIALYRLVKRKLQFNGKKVSDLNRERFRLLSDGFGGVKDVLLLGRQNDFESRFRNVSRDLARSKSLTASIGQVPKFGMELIAFSSLIFLVLYLLSSNSENPSTVLPILSVYAMAGFKLLPAFQLVYRSLSSVRANISAFETIKHDLQASRGSSAVEGVTHFDQMPLSQKLELKNVSFQYPNKDSLALHNITLTIHAQTTVGIIGHSGSGKSTLIDILMCLISPNSGSMLVDDKVVDSTNKRKWQNNIGYVAQSIFLTDTSIRSNIAFGLAEEDIDDSKVNKAMKMAHLEEFVDSMPDGVHTLVGERGVQLSGGQRQRIGIARALYDDAETLIFDEATSALDGVTETLVMNAICELAGTKTIVLVAHRLQTVRDCDLIFMLERGEIADTGTYDELLERNANFRKMSSLS